MTDIIVSAGHGDKIAGTSGNGMTEVQEAQKVAKRVVDILNQNKVTALYYHDATSTTQNANLANIVNHHNKLTRKIDVSVHFNNSGAAVSKGIGTEVFFKTGNADGEKLAATVSAAMAIAGKLTDRGAKTKVLRFTEKTNALGILLEIGFMNSATDMANYKTHFESICQSIAYTLAMAVNKDVLADWKGSVPGDVKALKLSVTQSQIQGEDVETTSDSISNIGTAYETGSYSTAANADGGFRVTQSGKVVVIDKQPLEETLVSPVYPDLVAPQKTKDEYVQPARALFNRDEEAQLFSIADRASFESFIKRGIDIAKIFFDYEDYQFRTQVFDHKTNKYKTKTPNFGKPANNNDPYPVDEKIEELEQHLPYMKIHRLTFNEPDLHTIQLSKVIMDLSDKVEKRMGQLENHVATLTRNMFRVGARMHVNCVYYGGQSEFNKYKAIRCLHHDRINDGQIMTLDQCLNCTRYEPILGKTYEIENELGASEALANDNNQMAYQNMQDLIDQTRLEEKPEPKEKHFFDIKEILSKKRTDKDLPFNKMWPDGFKMKWDFVPSEKQKPHVQYDDGRDSERLPSNYKNVEHHNDPTGAGFGGIGIFYGPSSSNFMSTLGYGGGWNPQLGVTGTSGGAGESISLQSSEEVKKQVEKNEAVFNTVPATHAMYKYIEAGRKWANNVDSAIRNMKADFPEVEEWIKQCAEEHKLDPLLIYSICIIESTGRHKEGESGDFVGLMAVGKSQLPSTYFSMSAIEKMKANISAGAKHTQAKREAVWNSNNILNIGIAYNSGQGLIIGNSSKGYGPIYEPGLLKQDHDTWTYDQIWPNFVRNLDKQWPGETKRLEEKKAYYPKLHYVYLSLLNRQLGTVLSNAKASPLGFSIVFPYKPAYYKSKVLFCSDYGKRQVEDGKVEDHNGIDLQAGDNAEVIAACDGVISKVTLGENNGYGTTIELTHDSGYKLYYRHLHEVMVSLKATVKAGDTIATEGATGDTEGMKGTFLHFEVRDKAGKPVDPKQAMPYLKGQVGKKILVP